MEIYKEGERIIQSCIYQSKVALSEQSGREMNQDVNGNIKLFWKKVAKENGGKMENCNKIKNNNWEDDV